MIRQLFFFLTFLTLQSCVVHAQVFLIKDQMSKRAQKQYAEAEAKINVQQYAAAKENLDAILAKEPNSIDALFFRAQVFTELEEYGAAEADYEAALSLSDDYYRPAYYKLGLIEVLQEKYQEAVPHFEAYLAKANESDRNRTRVEGYLVETRVAASIRARVVPFEPVSMGDSINSKGKEYLPSFTADGQSLIYTVNYTGKEDFYFSQLNTEGEWIKGAPLEAVNTEMNEGGASLSADGRLLVFTGCHRPDGLGSCDLYYTENIDGEWQALRHPGEELNSRKWDSQPALSANGRYLYFASDRPGGLGENDIWRSTRQADGNWGKPENLGAPINTPGNDESPFLHADGQTLYFMSDGHPGLGSYDLFYVRLGDDGAWQAPENMGYPINTAAAEGALVVSLDGQTAYYTTDQNTEEGQRQDFDIYQFPLYEEAQPQLVTYLRGEVVDGKRKRALKGASVSVTINNEVGEQVIANRTTTADGSFLVVLPVGYNYSLNVEKEGYLFYSDRFELEGAFDREDPYVLEVPLQRIPETVSPTANEPIVLHNVLFATGSADLLPISTPELDRLAALLLANPELKIRVQGHTDNVGEESDNQQLSEARAQAVYSYLLGQNIATERLAFEGFGEGQPIDSNDTPEGRKRNRRTEFVLE